MLALLASGEENFGEVRLGKAAGALMGEWGGLLVAFAAVVSTLSAANAYALSSSELVIKLAVQGDVAPRWGTLTRHQHMWQAWPAPGIGLRAGAMIPTTWHGALG